MAHRRSGGYSVAKFANEAMDAIVYAGVFVFMIIRPFFIQAFLIPSGSMLQTLYLNDFIVANKAIYRYTEPKVGDIVVFKPPDWALNADQHDVDFIKRCQGVPGDVVEVREGFMFRNGARVNEAYLSDSPGNSTDANGHPAHTGADTGMREDWKLVHYTGKARPDLYDQYVPVQIQRIGLGDAEARFNYHVSVAHKYAAGIPLNPAPRTSWVLEDEWIPIANWSPEEKQYEQELESSPPAAVPKGYVLMMGDNRNNSFDGRAWGLVPRDDVIGRSEFIWLPFNRWRVTR